MNLKKIENERLGECYYRCEHPSGLVILLCPMPEFATSYGLFGTKYGSIDNCFRTGADADYLKVPDGIAHFLEHKLFESEDGSAFELFAKTGADSNAYTSFDKTCYLFSCTSNFSESLDALLTFVQEPYFTQQTVEKEQGIIGQEIRMYDDMPSWRVMFNLLEALYHESPVRVDIAGTVESIAEITADTLYRCYHTFYNLSNMVLSIAGNFDLEEACTIIERKLKPSQPVSIQRPPYAEPKQALKARVSQQFDVAIPMFYFGYKIVPEQEPMAFLRQQIELEILLDLLAGQSSAFYEDLYHKGLLNATFGTEVFSGRGFLTVFFGGESKDPDAVFASFSAMIAAAKQKGFSEDDLLASRNALYGKALKGLNDVENMATEMLGYEMMGVSLYDPLSLIASVTKEDIERRFASDFDEQALALSVVEPKHQQK